MKKKKRTGFKGINFHDLQKNRASASTFSTAGYDVNIDENSVMAVDNNDENQNESSNIRNNNVLDVSARKLEGKEVILDTPGPSSERESEVIDGYKIIDSRNIVNYG